MTVRLTIVCENTVGRPLAVLGEHGFACFVETPSGRWLFDTGRGESLLPNLETLGLPLSALDGIILSHGHNDHTGGLLPLLKLIGPRSVHAHPEVFSDRSWQGQHERRNISLPYTRVELEAAGADFCFHRDCTTIAPGIYFSGEIKRTNPSETGDPHLVCPADTPGNWSADPFIDDAALAIETVRGLVILLGCAHAGMINTIEHFRNMLKPKRIHAIVGGSHLGPAGDGQFNATLDYLGSLSVDRIGLSHCTGQIRSAQLHAKFPKRVFFANVGTVMEVS
jgi:7,8-dihydropterin-6-yl-methyl-4-(beta-D-ribofuranosyl)aminobenzene 5'-phosphate synthase